MAMNDTCSLCCKDQWLCKCPDAHKRVTMAVHTEPIPPGSHVRVILPPGPPPPCPACAAKDAEIALLRAGIGELNTEIDLKAERVRELDRAIGPVLDAHHRMNLRTPGTDDHARALDALYYAMVNLTAAFRPKQTAPPTGE